MRHPRTLLWNASEKKLHAPEQFGQRLGGICLITQVGNRIHFIPRTRPFEKKNGAHSDRGQCPPRNFTMVRVNTLMGDPPETRYGTATVVTPNPDPI